MYKPNRVGTPVIHTAQYTQSSGAPTLQYRANDSAIFPFNVINATPDQNFGHTAINWKGTPMAVLASNQISFVHQFVVPAPLEGDAIGVEVIGGIAIIVPASCTIQPYFAQIPNGITTVLGGDSLTSAPTYFGKAIQGLPGDSTLMLRTLTYKEQILPRATTSQLVAGTYAHGFAIFGGSGPYDVTFFNQQGSVRVNTDQDNIGYVDNLR